MTDSPRNSPEHWLRLAEAARATGVKLKDPEAKAEMERIAAGYERLAAWAERLQSRRFKDKE
jgi:hypothetical protein